MSGTPQFAPGVRGHTSFTTPGASAPRWSAGRSAPLSLRRRRRSCSRRVLSKFGVTCVVSSVQLSCASPSFPAASRTMELVSPRNPELFQTRQRSSFRSNALGEVRVFRFSCKLHSALATHAEPKNDTDYVGEFWEIGACTGPEHVSSCAGFDASRRIVRQSCCKQSGTRRAENSQRIAPESLAGRHPALSQLRHRAPAAP